MLLLDEPLSALDLKLRKAMQIELKRLQRDTGITFVFVTHDQEEALTMSDRIAVMSQGKVRQVGTPREIYDHPAERFVADFIGEANMLKGELVQAEGGRGRVRLVGGIEVPARIPDGAPRSGPVTVVVRPEHAALARDPDGPGLPATSRARSMSAPTPSIICALAERGAVRGAQPEHQRRRRRLRGRRPADASLIGDHGRAGAARLTRHGRERAVDRAQPLAAAGAGPRSCWRWARSGPLAIVFVYSFLTPGDYAGVKWIFSGEAWLNLFLQQDIFDDSWQWADAHLSIFARTVGLAVGTTLATLVLGFPTAWFIATRPKRSRSFWLFLVTIPFWCNLLVRTFAIMQLIRNEGVINTVLLLARA